MRRFFVMLAAFAAFLALAVAGYNHLSARVSPDLGLSAPSAAPAPEASPKPTPEEPVSFPVLPDYEFTALDEDGNEVRLSDQLGVPVILNFWASWCPPCAAEMPHYNKIAAGYGEEALRVIMVDMVGSDGETRENGAAFLEREGLSSFTVWYDERQEAAYTYGVTSLPTTVFIDANGNIVTAWAGAVDEAMLRLLLEEFLGL